MKKVFSLLLVFAITSISFAQTQQGIVKTRGRLVDGQIVAGTRLPGATITLNFGNPLVSDGQGLFSFAVPTAKSYSLVNATKQGYTLADPEFTQRSFSYSATNPFYVVLEDENQRQADINAATRKIRKNLLARLDKLEEEIETLKAQNKLTEEEYQERLKQLYDNQSDSEKLIKDMAERYATTDYDQLDEFNRQVQMYIEEGELQKADSLIRSKGNMEQRVAEYRNVVDANKKIREELEQSESGAAKAYEDLSQDLYRRHEIFLQKFQQDSALYCLKTRADLDTTNMEAVEDYADLCLNQKEFSESEKYYQICLRIAIRDNEYNCIGSTLYKLGNLYFFLLDYKNCEKYLKLALENREHLFQQNPEAYRNKIATIQDGLGILYFALHDHASSENYFKAGLENRELSFTQNLNTSRADLASSQHNLGVFYRQLHDFANSEKYSKLALENREQLFEQNPDANRADLASTQNSLGNLYRILNDYANSERFFKLAMDNYEELFKRNPNAYRSTLANTQKDIGILFYSRLDYSNCEKYFKLALQNYEELSRKNPKSYRAVLASMQNNMANLYNDLHDYTNTEIYYKLALDNYEKLFNQYPTTYLPALATLQNNIGDFYRIFRDYENGEKYLMLALENRSQLFKQYPDVYCEDLALTQLNLGVLYYDIHDYANSEKYFKLALDNIEQLFKKNPNIYRFYLAMIQNNLGDLYCESHDYTNSEKYYKLALENREQLFKENPDAYGGRLAKTYNNLVSLFIKENHFSEAIETINKAIAIMPEEAGLYDTKGEILLKQGKNAEALEMWKKVLELNPDFLKENPDGTNLSNGLKELELIE